ncbi:MAG: chlorophyll synthase ChlG [Rhodovarius sp.]|nr:chlorophyll synthase ChlG [Rhodovarius sp.]MCX7933504.1 chlorophyll synthase ChlG [Rhodovarius sp.]
MLGHAIALPAPSAVLELLKPVTWFPPCWAFLCGVVSAGVPLSGHAGEIALGLLLCGPMVCGASQALNDWYDREVDAINEPHRPIPSGRIPGRWGLFIAWGWAGLSLLVAALLGPVVVGATLIGLFFAWAYSAPPLRLKLDGWWGNAACGLSYEGLAWVTGAAVMLGGALPPVEILLLALLYSIGAHGIMTLNDFKAIEGDRRMGVRSLPVQLGPERAARLACWVMALPQVVVILLLIHWAKPWHGLAIAGLLAAQVLAMLRLLEDPRARAPWFNAVGVLLSVVGMMVAAAAVGGRP